MNRGGTHGPRYHFDLIGWLKFDAYRCDPDGTTKGAIIVVQEIFGVNRHIRDVTERFANVGYTAIAPALFDRWHKDFDGGYNATICPSGVI